jgi:hypothetical protein
MFFQGHFADAPPTNKTILHTRGVEPSKNKVAKNFGHYSPHTWS